jgi:hypothetical protein
MTKRVALGLGQINLVLGPFPIKKKGL